MGSSASTGAVGAVVAKVAVAARERKKMVRTMIGDGVPAETSVRWRQRRAIVKKIARCTALRPLVAAAIAGPANRVASRAWSVALSGPRVKLPGSRDSLRWPCLQSCGSRSPRSSFGEGRGDEGSEERDEGTRRGRNGQARCQEGCSAVRHQRLRPFRLVSVGGKGRILDVRTIQRHSPAPDLPCLVRRGRRRCQR